MAAGADMNPYIKWGPSFESVRTEFQSVGELFANAGRTNYYQPIGNEVSALLDELEAARKRESSPEVQMLITKSLVQLKPHAAAVRTAYNKFDTTPGPFPARFGVWRCMNSVPLMSNIKSSLVSEIANQQRLAKMAEQSTTDEQQPTEQKT